MTDLIRHAWTGTRWQPCLSFDLHARGVARNWPGATAQHVACGVVHRRDGRIVAEVRRKNGWPTWEDWIAVPARKPVTEALSMTRSESITNLVPALIAAQRAMGPALRTAVNPHYRTRYVNLEGAWEACREALWANGLTVVQTTSVIGPSDTRLETLLAHTSGEWIAGEYPLRPVKDDPGYLGAALTYARRYGLMAIVGLAPEDDDGQYANRPTPAYPRGRYQRGREPGEDEGPAPKDEPQPTLGNPTPRTRERWARWKDRLIERWAEVEPLQGEGDRNAREHRIAQALITEAGPVFERLCYKPAEAGKDPVRDPRKVWETVHRLAAGDWEWTKAASLKHLKRHVAIPQDGESRS